MEEVSSDSKLVGRPGLIWNSSILAPIFLQALVTPDARHGVAVRALSLAFAPIRIGNKLGTSSSHSLTSKSDTST